MDSGDRQRLTLAWMLKVESLEEAITWFPLAESCAEDLGGLPSSRESSRTGH